LPVGLNMIVYMLSLTFSLNLSYGVRPCHWERMFSCLLANGILLDKALSRLDYNITVFCIPAVILYVV